MANVTTPFVKVNNAWTQAVAWVKIDGTWRQCFSNVKIQENWKPGSPDVGLMLFPNPDPISNSLKSSKYSVSVYDGTQYQDAHVYSGTKQAWVHPAAISPLWASGSYPVISYLTFSVSSPTLVKISKPGQSITSIDIGPYRKGKNNQTNISVGGEAFVPVNPDDKLWININNEVSSPLFIFADSRFPSYNEVTAMYPGYTHILYTTGIYNLSNGPNTDFAEGYSSRRRILSDTVVYVSGGAYLRGNFNMSGSNNVKFMGQGILSLDNFDWWGSIKNSAEEVKAHYAAFYNTNPSTQNSYLDARLSGNAISGLTVINTPYHFNGDGSFQSIENLKHISPWNYNSDGPRLGNFYFPAVGAKMTKSFIFNADDSAFPVLGQSFGSYVVSSCYISSHHGSVFVNYFPNYISYYNYSSVVADIDTRAYVPSENGKGAVFRLLTDYTLTAFPDTPPTNYRGPINLTFSSINIENPIEVPLIMLGNIQYPYGDAPPYGKLLGMVSGIEFKNITASGLPGYNYVSSNIVSGFNSTNKVTDVTFTNLLINGTYVTNSNYDNYFDVTGATNKTTDRINFITSP